MCVSPVRLEAQHLSPCLDRFPIAPERRQDGGHPGPVDRLIRVGRDGRLRLGQRAARIAVPLGESAQEEVTLTEIGFSHVTVRLMLSTSALSPHPCSQPQS